VKEPRWLFLFCTGQGTCMGIIKKDKAPNSVDTIIGCKTIFEGILLSNESICIEGTVKGKIECRGNIVVGKGGKVKADIIADNAFIGGQVNGNIKVKNRTEITSTGKVVGDIETSALVIGEGVFFEGSCHMTGAKSNPGSAADDAKEPLKQTASENCTAQSRLSEAQG